MRLLISWVRDFVDVTASADQIAETLGLRGFEVASIDRLDDHDAVIDFEVTANRPDCLSVLGLAREIATAYDLPLRTPSAGAASTLRLANLPSGTSEAITVTVEDADLCPRYAGAVAHVAHAVSPAWMTSRLQAAGVRPISPIVDITNYVLMELGQPMHAFDLDRLEGHELRIRRARAGESITTLDNLDRVLSAETLVIADAQRAQAVAGVMGGATSEVTGSTRTVVFESACFAPASVRRTSKRLGIKTEASSRFERGTDINMPVVAMQRAIALMEQLGAGRPDGSIVDCYASPRGPRPLSLRRDRLVRLLGLAVPDAEVARILAALGLDVVPTDAGWNVQAPTFRVDLLRDVDLIEEIGRHFGFDKLEPAFPAVTAAAAPPDPRVGRDQLVRRVLSSAGLSEAITFGFIERATAQAFAPGDAGAQVVGVANPLSAKFDALRPSLVPGLLEAVAHNRRHGRRAVALYEIGARFTRDEGEARAVGMAWTGSPTPEHWSTPPRDVDFFDATGAVELLASALGSNVSFAPALVAFLVPGQAAMVLAGGEPVGFVGQLTPALVDRAGAPRQDTVFAAELNLDRLMAATKPPAETVRALPRHPFVVRDLSIVVADTLPATDIRATILSAGGSAAAPLVDVAFFDRYQGKGVAAGSVSVSIRLTFQAGDRTLTDRDVQHAFDGILSALVHSHGAVQR